jgi:hypothetical protein
MVGGLSYLPLSVGIVASYLGIGASVETEMLNSNLLSAWDFCNSGTEYCVKKRKDI